MDRWIHDVLGTDFEREIGKLGEFPSSFSFPKGDIIETNSDVQIILDVPGIPKDKLELSRYGSCFLLEGKRNEPLSPTLAGSLNTAIIHQQHRFYGEFKKRICLPKAMEGVDLNSLQTTLKDGVLVMKMKKMEEGKQSTARTKVEIS